MHQVEIISLDDIVPADHNYRKFKTIRNFKYVDKQLKKLEKDNPYKGYGLSRLFKCLLLQFMEDLRDRELSRYIQKIMRQNGSASLAWRRRRQILRFIANLEIA
ncbi:MAG: hypothetical protein A3E87_10415 [Gammaproteobacteria bacterium RIFCSPHIGHO2_12_FULL_35_23]|nr:MAG: hypothetical protein A3E87_10415 [Gammaproteobacteria bacterium RIFCSPHIGHO2_12_FULL_35_23]